MLRPDNNRKDMPGWILPSYYPHGAYITGTYYYVDGSTFTDPK